MSTTNPTPLDADLEMEAGNRLAQATLRTLMRYRALTNKDLAARVGLKPNRVQHYTGGPGQITAGLMRLFAPALGVEPYVLAMGEDEALTWVLAHAPNGSLVAGDTHRFPRAITHAFDTGQLTLWSTSPEGEIDLREICELPSAGVVSGTGSLSLQGSAAA